MSSLSRLVGLLLNVPVNSYWHVETISSTHRPFFLDKLDGSVDLLFIVTPIVRVYNCSMCSCTLLYVHSSFAITLMGKRELVA